MFSFVGLSSPSTFIWDLGIKLRLSFIVASTHMLDHLDHPVCFFCYTNNSLYIHVYKRICGLYFFLFLRLGFYVALAILELYQARLELRDLPASVSQALG